MLSVAQLKVADPDPDRSQRALSAKVPLSRPAPLVRCRSYLWAVPPRPSADAGKAPLLGRGFALYVLYSGCAREKSYAPPRRAGPARARRRARPLPLSGALRRLACSVSDLCVFESGAAFGCTTCACAPVGPANSACLPRVALHIRPCDVSAMPMPFHAIQERSAPRSA